MRESSCISGLSCQSWSWKLSFLCSRARQGSGEETIPLLPQLGDRAPRGPCWCPGSQWQPHGQAKIPGFRKSWEKKLDVDFCMLNTYSKSHSKVSKKKGNVIRVVYMAGSAIPLQRCPEISAVSVLVWFSFSTLPVFSHSAEQRQIGERRQVNANKLECIKLLSQMGKLPFITGAKL